MPDATQQDVFNLRLPGRERQVAAREEASRTRDQRKLLKSLYASERTVALLQQIPNMRPFLKENYGPPPQEQRRFIRDLEGELREKTPNIRGEASKPFAHDRSACLDLMHAGIDGKSPTLLAVGKHKFNWEYELDAARGPGTYDYEHVKGGIIKKSQNWKWKRFEMFPPESDDEDKDDAKDEIIKEDNKSDSAKSGEVE